MHKEVDLVLTTVQKNLILVIFLKKFVCSIILCTKLKILISGGATEICNFQRRIEMIEKVNHLKHQYNKSKKKIYKKDSAVD